MHEVFSDPHVIARGLVVEQSLGGGLPATPMIGNPIKFSRTPIAYGDAPPRLGAHTAEIVRRSLGTAEPNFQRLVDEGIVSTDKV